MLIINKINEGIIIILTRHVFYSWLFGYDISITIIKAVAKTYFTITLSRTKVIIPD